MQDAHARKCMNVAPVGLSHARRSTMCHPCTPVRAQSLGCHQASTSLLHVEQEAATCVAIFVPGEAQADGRGLLGKRSKEQQSASLPQKQKTKKNPSHCQESAVQRGITKSRLEISSYESHESIAGGGSMKPCRSSLSGGVFSGWLQGARGGIKGLGRASATSDLETRDR